MVRVLRALLGASLVLFLGIHALPEDASDDCVKVVRVRRIVHAESEDAPGVTTELLVTTTIATSLSVLTSTTVATSHALLTHTTVATSLAMLTRTTVEATTATFGLEIPPVTIVSAVTVASDARVVPLPVPRFVPYKCPSRPCVVEKRVPVPLPVIVQPTAAACPAAPTVTLTSISTATIVETATARFVECGDSTDDDVHVALPQPVSASRAAVPTIDPVFASVNAEFSAVMTLMSAPTVCLARR